jgi:hypothetical protein
MKQKWVHTLKFFSQRDTLLTLNSIDPLTCMQNSISRHELRCIYLKYKIVECYCVNKYQVATTMIENNASKLCALNK